MNTRNTKLLLVGLLMQILIGQGIAQTSSITYNGSLFDGGLPAGGNYDFQFDLYDAASEGVHIGPTLFLNNLSVVSGGFSATLNFGSASFTGADRWLQVSVRQAGVGSYVVQLPRTLLSSAPYAIRAITVTGPVTSAQPGITDPDINNNLPPSGLLVMQTASNDVTAGLIAKANSTNGIGIIGISSGSQSTALSGFATSTSGETAGVEAFVLSPNGTAVKASNNGNGGDLFRGKGNGGRQFRVDSQANVTIDGNTGILGHLEVGNSLNVQGNIGAYGVIGTGFVNGGSLRIDGNGSINGTLTTAIVKTESLFSGYGSIGGLYANNANVFGNVNIDGDLTVGGAKQAVVKLADGREVGMYAVESPQNWFEDIGSGRLKNGRAFVEFDRTFTMTVNVAVPYKVFLTPGGNCMGLYISRKTANGFEVRELRGGRSNISFDYRIMAIRMRYENVRFGVGSPSGTPDERSK